MATRTDRPAGVDLYWLPLGSGARCVRTSGRLYEALVAHHQRRPACALYHAALEVWADGHRHVVEVAPVWDRPEPDRGVVAEGPVGARVLGRSRWFRYEVRRWRDGTIPDLDWAVGGVRRVADGEDVARRTLATVAHVPAVTWGRDELRAGEMWNSNAAVAWVLATAGVDLAPLGPPAGGRAPGWGAGLVVATRTARAPAPVG